MPSETAQEQRSWSDPRFFITTFLMPFGALSYALTTVLTVWVLNHEIRNEAGLSTPRVVVDICFVLLGFTWALYATIGLAQVFFLEIRERFVAHKVDYRDGEFQLRGYGFKRASFRADEVASVEPLILSEKWIQKRTGSLLSRSTKFTIPHGKNVNLKITLTDGRVYFFPGEMGRPGQWKDEDVKELRDFMESLAAQ